MPFIDYCNLGLKKEHTGSGSSEVNGLPSQDPKTDALVEIINSIQVQDLIK